MIDIARLAAITDTLQSLFEELGFKHTDAPEDIEHNLNLLEQIRQYINQDDKIADKTSHPLYVFYQKVKNSLDLQETLLVKNMLAQSHGQQDQDIKVERSPVGLIVDFNSDPLSTFYIIRDIEDDQGNDIFGVFSSQLHDIFRGENSLQQAMEEVKILRQMVLQDRNQSPHDSKDKLDE